MREAPTIFLVGPTASGKTVVGVALARELDAEIVSADSMQVYRGMDIGTAKPTEVERGGVPHHLIDVAEITEPFDVARYRQLALTAIAGIHRRGKTALVVGGTGLYVRALTRGLDAMPEVDPELRARLEAQSLEQLVAILHRRDALATQKIDLQNKRRVVRALEVLELTGQSIVSHQKQWGEANEVNSSFLMPNPIIGIARPRDELYSRIDARTEEMFSRGLVEEVRRLLACGLEKNHTAMQAVGYKEVAAHLRGETTLDACKTTVKQATRHLAKRQLTWFRRETTLVWIEFGKEEVLEETTQKVLKAIERFQREDGL